MEDLYIGEECIKAGQSRAIALPISKLYTNTELSIPIHVMRSKKPGSTIFISAAIHGDELNGVEIIRRLISKQKIKLTMGTLIFVPMVNVYGVLNQSRYLPDRRDLNRSFPGSEKGSLAGRVANLFLEEVVSKCDYGIDLHTGAIHRSNLPQIRANLADEKTLELAKAFGVPVLINSTLRDGSLREAGNEAGSRILLYEAGEALRFDEFSIRAGVKGVLNVLEKLEMIKPRRKKTMIDPFVADKSSWTRAPCSGIVRDIAKLGDQVKKGDKLSEIGDPFGKLIENVIAPRSGIIIGKQNIPLIQEGDAMFHIAYFSDDDEEIAETIEMLQDDLLTSPNPNMLESGSE